MNEELEEAIRYLLVMADNPGSVCSFREAIDRLRREMVAHDWLKQLRIRAVHDLANPRAC